jgi:hypothetical protein
MSYRKSVAHLDHAQTGGRRQKVCPAHLKKIKMVSLPLTRESARQNERRRHAAAGQGFEARWYAAVREINPRATVQRIELISVAGPDTAPSVRKQQLAALIGSGSGERLGLRGPLPASRGIKVSPLGQWSADLYAISREPAKLIRLLHQSANRRGRQVRGRKRRTGVRCGKRAMPGSAWRG